MNVITVLLANETDKIFGTYTYLWDDNFFKPLRLTIRIAGRSVFSQAATMFWVAIRPYIVIYCIITSLRTTERPTVSMV